MSTNTPSSNISRMALALGFALLLGACGQAIADSGDGNPETTTAQPTTTSAPLDSTTTMPPTDVPDVVPVPELAGRTLAEATQLLTEAELGLKALPAAAADSAVVVAQDPAPGVQVHEGTVVTVDVHIVPTCNPPDPVAPGIGEVTITVLYECGNDTTFPTPGIGVPRIVPEDGGDTIDRLEWTLRSLLAGPTDDERGVGFGSFFDAATVDALISVTLTDGHVVADFNDAIIVNNMSTSTGGVFFNAELLRNVFLQSGVDSAEFRLDGSCEAWSALFESDGCWVISRADWDERLVSWDELRNQ
ncbi:PASTA domain-containing protein [Actinomycetota bacterium]